MSTDSERLPWEIYSSAQVREFDRLAVEAADITSFDLMKRAGQAAFECVKRRWPSARKLRIFCGPGNNGGDGYVLAALAAASGLTVRVVSLVEPSALRGDAALARAEAERGGVQIERFEDLDPFGRDLPDLVVDAILGSGITRELVGAYATVVQAINATNHPVLALDCPSGIDSDSGAVLGVAVHADATLTFVGLKQGLYLGSALDYCGELEFAGLAIPSGVRAAATPRFSRITEAVLRPLLNPRPRSSHKGMNGRVVLIGGSPGLSGAIRLAAVAALRAGAGLVHVATHPACVQAVTHAHPEIMCRGIDSLDEVDDWLWQADAVVVGPGLGSSEWSRKIFAALLPASTPLVIDADGLNWLAEGENQRFAGLSNCLLTPHPGEAARLLKISVSDVQADRLAAVRRLAARFGTNIILKGACSLVSETNEYKEITVSVCDRGNAGMATGGTGDVLAGIAGALAAQSGGMLGVAAAAALVHALAGDDAARAGERGLIASDLMPFIRARVNPA